jgi:ABC-2 type transport system permease protein
MLRVFDIARKDLLQLMRDRKTFLFLLIMPIAFTFLLGFASGGFNRAATDSRLPVGYLDLDHRLVSQKLHNLLASSDVIRLVEGQARTPNELETLVTEEKVAGAIIVPAGYSKTLLNGKTAKLTLIANTNTTIGLTIQNTALSAASRLDSAVRTAIIMEGINADQSPFDYTLDQALTAWHDPPISVSQTTSSVIVKEDDSAASLAHTAPAMMLQFAIAGLLTAAQVLVSERKSGSLQRLLTTASSRSQILLGHYLAIFILIFGQFVVLISFGQLLLKVNYQRDPLAILVIASVSALCIAGLGLLIGAVAKSEEQAVIFSLIPMFLLSGLGGAWVPLEVTSPTFQAIGHLSPVAWAMDAFMDITIRGLGVSAVLLSVLALAGYAVLFFTLAALRFRAISETL